MLLTTKISLWIPFFGLALLLTSPAMAQRPSLLDLQAAVDGLVSPTPPAPGGTIRFSGGAADGVEFDLVDLTVDVQAAYSCTGAGCSFFLGFSSISATLVQTANVALLNSDLLTGAFHGVEFNLDRDQSRVLVFTDAILESVGTTGVSGRSNVTFSFQTINFDWQGR